MRKLIFLFVCFIAGISSVLAQTSISGKVISGDDGEPVIGATVMLKGTTTGTITGADGEFSIVVTPENRTLVVSFIGMITVEVEAVNNMTVTLSTSVSELDEVIVTAFGLSTKKSFTGAAAVIKSEELAKNQSSNITNNLAGKVAGVQGLSANGQPGSGSNIRIRGIGSMSSSNAPLYVVDGVPYDTDISAVNNADIESVTVLKDAASAALYGARGANGVIIITTKRGKGKDAQVKIDTKWGNNSRAIPAYNVMTDPGMYYENFYRAMYNSRVNKDGVDGAHEYANNYLLDASQGGLGYQVYTVPNGERLIGKNFKLNPNAKLGYSDGTFTYLPDKWYDEVFNPKNLRQEYNLSVSGSADKLTYFFSANYLHDTGIVSNSDFQRFSSRLNTDYQVKKWLKLVSNMSYIRSDSRYPDEQVSDRSSGNLFFVSNMLAPIYPLYVRDAKGKIMTDDRGYTLYDYGEGKIVNAKRPFMSQSNPASNLMLNTEKFSNDYFVGKWSAVAEIFDGFKATATLGATTANTHYNMLQNPYYGQFADGGGYVSVQYGRFYSINQQYLLTYEKQFGEHNVDLMAGTESYKFKNASLYGFKTKVYQDRVPELNNAILDPSTGSSSYTYSTLGFLAQAKYDFASKYFASASYRRDGSSSFAPENRWGNFWSVGAAWDLKSESFLDNAEFIDLLKLKASYGAQGNDKLLYAGSSSINFYPYQDQFVVSENNGEFATERSYKGNRDITWETSYNFNTGVEFSLFSERLNGGVEFFSRKTVDMLYYQPVAPSMGYTELPVNIGSVRNLGVEIELDADIVKTRSVTWNMYANATFLKNKILELSPELEGQWISGSYIYKEGESMYNFYIRETAGVDELTGDPLWYMDIVDAEGNVTGRETTNNWSKGTRYEQGDILPKVYGGFGTSLEAYGFDCSLEFAYQMGGRVLDNSYLTLMHSGYSSDAGRNWHADILNAWTPENTKTDVPRLNSANQYSNSTSNRFLISSDYLSLQNITLGYTLPKRLLERIKIEKLRIFGVADNVALFTARQGLDPRQSFTVAYSGSLYAPIRSISGGLNITF